MRTVTRVALLALGVAGCQPNYAAVDEACLDSDQAVPGSDGATENGEAFMRRLTCYRRFVGISKARMSPLVDEAAQAHARYLEEHVLSNPEATSWQFEVRGLSWYRGDDARDRIDYAGYELEGYSNFIWEVLGPAPESVSPPDTVDALMHDPFVRDALLAPGWRVSGYGEAEGDWLGRVFYLNAVLALPSLVRATSPVTYPMDGQTDVPVSWFNYWYGSPPFDELPVELGYPITLTMGSAQVGAGNNPLQIVVDEHSITGPDGEIEAVRIFPGPHDGGFNWSTVILLPVEPLQPGSQYTVEVTASWISHPGRTMSWTFETGSHAAATTLSREAPDRPVWTARPRSL